MVAMAIPTSWAPVLLSGSFAALSLCVNKFFTIFCKEPPVGLDQGLSKSILLSYELVFSLNSKCVCIRATS